MKPKIVSVKKLEVPVQAPPSENEFVFLEMHGQLHSPSAEKPVAQNAIVPVVAKEKKGFLGWLKGVFGK